MAILFEQACDERWWKEYAEELENSAGCATPVVLSLIHIWSGAHGEYIPEQRAEQVIQ